MVERRNSSFGSGDLNMSPMIKPEKLSAFASLNKKKNSESLKMNRKDSDSMSADD